MTDLVRLEELARAATPGPWGRYVDENGNAVSIRKYVVGDSGGTVSKDIANFALPSDSGPKNARTTWAEINANAEFIEACAEAIPALIQLLKDREGEIERLRDVLLGIAETDHYGRYPKQRADGGFRGQSGLRAVRALTGQHGSYINDDDVRRLDREARQSFNGGASS